MYKKTVRRRRAVLGGLVALSLILLTAYFGESGSGLLHDVQRGFLTVLSPVEKGARTVFSPVRGAFDSIGGAFSSAGKAKRLERELARVRAQVVAYAGEAREYREWVALGRIDTRLSLQRYRPVRARVIALSPTIWYETVVVDQGTNAGVRDGDPVLSSEGLIGKVTLAGADASQVTLITDHEMAVSARLDGNGASGILKPKVGTPDELVMEYLAPAETNVNAGEYVVTAGNVAGSGESLFPPGIAIGEVKATGGSYSAVDVRPLANLHNLGPLEILSAVGGSAPSRLTQIANSLSFGAAPAGPTGASAPQLPGGGEG